MQVLESLVNSLLSQFESRLDVSFLGDIIKEPTLFLLCALLIAMAVLTGQRTTFCDVDMFYLVSQDVYLVI